MAGPPRVWALTDDRPGNANQALGVAEALDWPFEVRDIRYGRLARLPNALLGVGLAGLTEPARRALRPPWPDLVIGAGRRTAPVARWLKRRHPEAFLVQLMWPGMCGDFDLVAVPEHDATPRGDKVIRTLGTPHRLTPERLAAAARALGAQIAHLPRPRIVVLVGGTSRHAVFTPEDAAALARDAGALAAGRGGSLLLTTSRRTGGACEAALRQALPSNVPTWLHRFSEPGDNPYAGFLGSADGVVVSADSASMCTEACAAGCPVFLFTPQAGIAPKLARLHARLAALGYLRALGEAWPERVPPPLQPQRAVADAIRERLRERASAGRCTAEAVAHSAATH